MAHAAGIKFPLDKQFTEHTSLSFDRHEIAACYYSALAVRPLAVIAAPKVRLSNAIPVMITRSMKQSFCRCRVRDIIKKKTDGYRNPEK